MDYAWSSVACGYALTAGKRAKWLAVGEGLRELGYTDTAAGRREFVRGLDRRAAEEVAERAGVPVEDAEADRRMSSLRRGWYWGSQAFAEGMLKLGEATLKKGAPPRIPCQWGKPRAWPARGGAVAGAGIASRGVNDRELAVKPGSSLIKGRHSPGYMGKHPGGFAVDRKPPSHEKPRKRQPTTAPPAKPKDEAPHPPPKVGQSVKKCCLTPYLLTPPNIEAIFFSIFSRSMDRASFSFVRARRCSRCLRLRLGVVMVGDFSFAERILSCQECCRLDQRCFQGCKT